MESLILYLYSVKKKQRIEFKVNATLTETDVDKMWQTVYRGCEVDSLGSYGSRIVCGEKTRKVLEDLKEKYDDRTNKRIRKLYGFLNCLKEGEHFYIIKECEASFVERRTALDVLRYSPDSQGWIAIHNKRFHHYTMLSTYFTVHSFGHDEIEVRVGEADKNKRECRFCGCSDPAKFHNEAHAIQESLGNRILFCNEECDDCNHSLNKVEDNLLYLMDFRRAMYGIHRKQKTSPVRVVGENYLIKTDDKGDIHIYLIRERINPHQVDQNTILVRLNHKTKITNENLYKALVKIVIDVIPTQYLCHFEQTISWLTGDMKFICEKMPSAKSAVISNDVEFRQPSIDILINDKNNCPNSPYCTAVLYIYDMIYMFVVPFVDVDRGQYSNDSELYAHWELMNRFFSFPWYTQNTSEWWDATPWVDEKFNLKSPYVHIVSESEPIVAECVRNNSEIHQTVFPPFGLRYLTLVRVFEAVFTNLYNGSPLTIADLKDVTMFFNPPIISINRQFNKVQSLLSFDAYDTTGKIPFYRVRINMLYDIKALKEHYIETEDPNDKDSVYVELDYQVGHTIFDKTLADAEQIIASQRKGTYFVNCSLTKLQESVRLKENLCIRFI